jgi:hypothetical protein
VAKQQSSGIDIRVVRPDDDLDTQLDLAGRAFGLKSADERERWLQTVSGLIAQGRCLGAYDGGRLAGGAMFHDMRLLSQLPDTPPGCTIPRPGTGKF